jgi:hypothetical protein
MSAGKEIQKALLAHRRWKNRIEKAIATGRSTFKIENVKADNRCKFSTWLYALPDQTTEEWKRVQRLHALFHEEAARVLELALRGQKDEAKQAISLTSHYCDLSVKMTNALLALKKRKSESDGPI